MFDYNKDVTIVGDVKELQWTNPHITCSSTSRRQRGVNEWISRAGRWRSQTHRVDARHTEAGDKVSVRIHPRKDRTNGGQWCSRVVTGSDRRRCDTNAITVMMMTRDDFQLADGSLAATALVVALSRYAWPPDRRPQASRRDATATANARDFNGVWRTINAPAASREGSSLRVAAGAR